MTEPAQKPTTWHDIEWKKGIQPAAPRPEKSVWMESADRNRILRLPATHPHRIALIEQLAKEGKI